MVGLIEVLASHSIMAAELKQLIGSLRPIEDGHLPSYYYKLQQVLCTVAHQTEGVAPLYYFDLRGEGSHIHITSLQQWPNSGSFSFHAWVQLDQNVTKTQSSLDRDLHNTSGKHRRVLYSFFSRPTSGFEAFFTESNNLVVATATKKEYHTLLVRDPVFRRSEWVHVCIFTVYV